MGSKTYWIEERTHCDKCDGRGYLPGDDEVEYCPAYTTRMIEVELTSMPNGIGFTLKTED